MLSKKSILLTILIICASSIHFSTLAQKASVRATVDPAEILIGQQATLNLEVISPKDHQILLPVFQDSIITGIEVIGMVKPDTLYANDVMTITQKYIVTSFDSALYHIPYIPVIDNADTIKSNSLGLKVTSPELTNKTLTYLEKIKQAPADSLNIKELGAYDIKTIQELPFSFWDYIYYILLIATILIIIAIIMAIYMYRKKKKVGFIFKPKPSEPAHILALNALNHIKEEKLWQKGLDKEYYTELTNILRKYIAERFHLNAFEMTSEEIISVIDRFVNNDSACKGLTQVLRLADLVKFAKFKPFPDENDLSLVNSFLFVNQTKKEEIDNNTDNSLVGNKHQQNNDQEHDESIDWTIKEEDKIDFKSH